jgi:hypothetical protein
MTKQKEFYINLGLSELKQLQRISALAWVAYIFFKRNIDFATGESSKSFSLSEMGRLWTRPAKQGRAADDVRIERVRTIITELTKCGLVNFDYVTKKFNLPMHDRTPTEKTTAEKSVSIPVVKSVPPRTPASPIKPTVSKDVVFESVVNNGQSAHPNTPMVLNQTKIHSLVDKNQTENFEEWIKYRLKESKFLYVNNPNSAGYYSNWVRLFNKGKLDKPKFETILGKLLDDSTDDLTPMLLNKLIKNSQNLTNPEQPNQRRGFAWL